MTPGRHKISGHQTLYFRTDHVIPPEVGRGDLFIYNFACGCFACLYVYVSYVCQMVARKQYQISGTGITDGTAWWVLGIKPPGRLEKQPLLLTTEPSFQSEESYFAEQLWTAFSLIRSCNDDVILTRPGCGKDDMLRKKQHEGLTADGWGRKILWSPKQLCLKRAQHMGISVT